MKKWVKVLITIIAIPIVLFIVFLGAYIVINWQGVIEPYQIGNSNANQKILIASQGSEFKNNLEKELIRLLKNDNTFLSIVDCTTLGHEDAADWDAVIIIHTTQIHGMPEEVRDFLLSSDDLSKILLVTTSGGGDEVVTEFEVSAISTASRLSVTSIITKWLTSRLDSILGKESNLTAANNLVAQE